MRTYALSGILLICLLSACVTTQDATELEEQVDYYKDQALQSDSISTEYRNLLEEKRTTEIELNNLLNELERMRATNISLNRSYQEILAKFNEQLDKNTEVVATTSYENQSLQERLYENQSNLDEQERRLAQTQYELSSTRRGLNVMEYNYKGLEANSGLQQQKIQELESALAIKEQKMANLRASVSQAIIGFTNEDLTVSERNGKLYVSMSQSLLFAPGSQEIDWRGKKALKQVADALNQNLDIDIFVEGHTDAEGTAARNWDLSVLRATSVVKILTNYGVAPERITAAGRGFFAPIAQNDSKQGKAQNRRTEIVLSPKLDELYQIMDR
ncbi:MAG: OmpA family protein [Saprospiraceae bacterium]|nr:OmpA family protein [Saprospiraceae bacterium]